MPPTVAEVAGVRLSARELDVLRCLVTGHDSNKAAARVLGVQPSTINDYLRILYRKLGVRSRVAAAVWAVRNGIA
jgi:two-component system nitrate/nitrite response regulator NarL